jgi:EAL domain-containing protein (putative c-di-GMP-specific phosphodiesterase class I)
MKSALDDFGTGYSSLFFQEDYIREYYGNRAAQ